MVSPSDPSPKDQPEVFRQILHHGQRYAGHVPPDISAALVFCFFPHSYNLFLLIVFEFPSATISKKKSPHQYPYSDGQILHVFAGWSHPVPLPMCKMVLPDSPFSAKTEYSFPLRQSCQNNYPSYLRSDEVYPLHTGCHLCSLVQQSDIHLH